MRVKGVMAKCEVCGKVSRVITNALKVCSECLRLRFEKAEPNAGERRYG